MFDVCLQFVGPVKCFAAEHARKHKCIKRLFLRSTVTAHMDKGKLHPYVHEIQFCQGNPVGYSSGDQNILERKKSNEDPQRNRIFLLSSLVYNLEIFSR